MEIEQKPVVTMCYDTLSECNRRGSISVTIPAPTTNLEQQVFALPSLRRCRHLPLLKIFTAHLQLQLRNSARDSAKIINSEKKHLFSHSY